jgi:hypothetical protein
MLFDDDNHALSMGRYYRAARFPVVDPAITYMSYEKLIRLELSKLSFLSGTEKRLTRQMLRMMLDYMMCLPASSTFHHRTAGGLFYHSLETAALAAEKIRDTAQPTEGQILAAFLGGLLHDLGKVLTLFHVYPLSLRDQDHGFGSLQEPFPDAERWQPHDESLWAWCSRQKVKYLALHYQTDGPIGHEAAAAPFWRDFLPDELMQALLQRDAEAAAILISYLDHENFNDPLVKAIKTADHISRDRDINPLFRWAPKRSDLHVLRRFIEFASISRWNHSTSPFMMADVWIKGADSSHTLPFFRTQYFDLGAFKSYLLSEDLYGCALSHNGDINALAAILERYGLLNRQVPICPVGRVEPIGEGFRPAFWANVKYIEEEDAEPVREPLSYFPFGARIAPHGTCALQVYI